MPTLSPIEVTSTALKIEAPVTETPRPVSVITEQDLEIHDFQSLDDAMRYRSGALSGLYGDDNDTDWIKVRGFDASTYQDGMRIYQTGYYHWVTEPWGLEKVELLKGPASILYGEVAPGGVINTISKRPTRQPRGKLQVQTGNRNLHWFGGDVSGPLTADGDVRYRLVGLFKQRDGELDQTHNDRYYIAPSLAIDLTDDTELTLLASFQKDNGVPTNPFKFAYGTLDSTPYGRVDPTTNFGEPSYDRNHRKQLFLGYELNHQFNQTWSFEQNLRYTRMELDLRSVYGLSHTGPQVTRGLVYRDGRLNSWQVDNQLVGHWFADNWENTLQIGLDYQKQELDGQRLDDFNFGQPLDMFDPEYGHFTPVAASQLQDHSLNSHQTGIYIQNQLRWNEHWVFLAGMRYDNVKIDDTLAGTYQKADVDELSLSGGVMYLADNGLAPYASYSESFQPIMGVDGNGNLYDPSIGKQIEAGIKYAPIWLDGYVTASAFRIKQDNTMVFSPSAGTQVQAGEQKTRGFELEGVGYLTPDLQLVATYTYTHAEIDESTVNRDVRAALIPRHMASLWLNYSLSGAFDGLTLGAGLRYAGKSTNTGGSIEVPSYTVADVMASYAFDDNWTLQVNVHNLANKKYVASCGYWCYYGASRSATASVSYSW